MRIYHFTSTTHLPLIEASGCIDLTESNVSAPWEWLAMPPVAWFVDVPVLEHDHGLGGSAVDKTAVRITVEVPDHWTLRWLDWANAQGIDDRWRDALVSGVGGYEAAQHWFITFRPIRRDRWIEITTMT